MLLSTGHRAISCGGGIIPVIDGNGELAYVDTVVNKNFADSFLADELDADNLIALTAVDKIHAD